MVCYNFYDEKNLNLTDFRKCPTASARADIMDSKRQIEKLKPYRLFHL